MRKHLFSCIIVYIARGESMYILKLRHGNSLQDLLIFDSEEQGQRFIDSFPLLEQDHYRVQEVVFSDYYFNPQKLPDFMTWEYEGVKIPISKFSFTEEDDKAYFELHPVDHFKNVSKTYVDGATKIDAWVIDNQEVKHYVETREKIATALMAALKEAGYQEIERCYFGSEDGEAIIGRKENDTFFEHLDAGLVHQFETSNKSLETFIKETLEQYQ